MSSTNQTPSNSTKTLQKSKIISAVEALLDALGYEISGDLQKTPQRVAKLWQEHLVCGKNADVESILTNSLMQSESNTPVCLTQIGTYLICPHHLTVAFGQTHVAFEPNGYLVGFGAMTQAVQATTAKLEFQENATQQLAQAIQKTIDTKTVVVMMTASHPCHTLTHPRSHASKVTTWGVQGSTSKVNDLRELLKTTLATSAH